MPRLVLILIALSMILAGGQATAITLQGFESGIPAGWFCAAGSRCATETAQTNINPTEGTSFGIIDTGDPPETPTIGTPDATTNTAFLGGGATSGSLLTSAPFHIASGQTLSLDLNFLTNNGTSTFRDFALVQLRQSGSSTAIANLFTADTTSDTPPAVQNVPCRLCPFDISPGVSLTPGTASLQGNEVGPVNDIVFVSENANGAPRGATGWVTSSFTPDPGSYQLFFAVTDADVSGGGDSTVPTGLAFDNIRLSSAPSAAVPEPGSVLLLGSGLVGLTIWRGMMVR